MLLTSLMDNDESIIDDIVFTLTPKALIYPNAPPALVIYFKQNAIFMSYIPDRCPVKHFAFHGNLASQVKCKSNIMRPNILSIGFVDSRTSKIVCARPLPDRFVPHGGIIFHLTIPRLRLWVRTRCTCGCGWWSEATARIVGATNAIAVCRVFKHTNSWGSLHLKSILF